MGAIIWGAVAIVLVGALVLILAVMRTVRR